MSERADMALRFRQCLNEYLPDAPISQRQFAFQAQMTQQKAHNLARHGRFGPDDLLLLYDLGIDMNWFVGGQGDPVRQEIRIQM